MVVVVERVEEHRLVAVVAGNNMPIAAAAQPDTAAAAESSRAVSVGIAVAVEPWNLLVASWWLKAEP